MLQGSIDTEDSGPQTGWTGGSHTGLTGAVGAGLRKARLWPLGFLFPRNMEAGGQAKGQDDPRDMARASSTVLRLVHAGTPSEGFT